MGRQLTIDTVTYDPNNDEFALYFVEDGPWPTTNDTEWKELLGRIQNKIFDAFDAIVDGHVGALYPDSAGKRFRIQIDSPHGAPAPLKDLVSKIRNYIDNSEEYREALSSSPHAIDVRIVTGEEMGRFIQR